MNAWLQAHERRAWFTAVAVLVAWLAWLNAFTIVLLWNFVGSRFPEAAVLAKTLVRAAWMVTSNGLPSIVAASAAALAIAAILAGTLRPAAEHEEVQHG